MTTVWSAALLLFLVMDYQQEQLGTITRLVHAVFGHDPTTDRYTMHWFDDRGEDPGAPAVGALKPPSQPTSTRPFIW